MEEITIDKTLNPIDPSQRGDKQESSGNIEDEMQDVNSPDVEGDSETEDTESNDEEVETGGDVPSTPIEDLPQYSSNFSVSTQDSGIKIIPADLIEGYYVLDVIYYSSIKEGDSLKYINLYENKPDSFSYYKIKDDGHYKIKHLVFPNEKWLNIYLQTLDVTYDNVYYVKDGKIYEYTKDNQTVEVPMSSLLDELNISESTIAYSDTSIFSIMNLYKCYVNWAEQTLSVCYSECQPVNSINSVQGKRDFIWSALNVIKYYVSFSQYFKAQKLLEKINKCGGICSNVLNSNNNGSDCGCNRAY